MSDYIDLNTLLIDEPKAGDLIILTRKTNNSIINTAFKTDMEYLKFIYGSPEEIEKITEGVKQVYPLINNEIAKYATDDEISIKSMKLNDAEFYRSKIITYENLSSLLENYLTTDDLSILISDIITDYQTKAYEIRSDLARVAVQGRSAVTTVVNAETMSEAISSIDMSSSNNDDDDDKDK